MHLNKSDKMIVFLGVITLLVALISVYFPLAALMYAIGGLAVSSIFVLLSKNRYGIAHLMAGYIVGIEVFLRMVKTGIPWEFGKYAVVILLTLGLLVEKRKLKIPMFFLIYPILFIPAIILTFDSIDFERARQLVISNIGGQLALFISVLYFYNRKITKTDFLDLLRIIVVGLSAIALFTYIKTPDFAAIAYTANSSAASSGGFSGNQVSTAYGLGIILLGISLYRNNVLFFSKKIDVIFLFLFFLLGFLTFSRGGVLGGILSLIIAIFVYKFLTGKQKGVKKSSIKILNLVSIAIVVVVAFYIIDQLTGNVLQQRYLNTDESGNYRTSKDITTNRGRISEADLWLFRKNFETGVGVGMGVSERIPYLGFRTAAHTEFTRVLGEHGIIGVIILLMMIFLPILHYIKIYKYPETVLVLAVMIIYSFITMTHSAMRLALPSFIYGLAFIHLLRQQD